MSPAPRLLVAVAVGGAVGALLRWAFGEWVGPANGFPWATFVVNVTGSAGLALLGALPVVRAHEVLVAGLGPGLLGGYTTLSAASDDTRALLASGDEALGAGYLVASVLTCVAAVVLVRALLPPAAEA